LEVIFEVNVMQKISSKALAILLILATAFNLVTIASVRAETPANTITVSGRGDRSIPTTKARVTIEVEVEAKTAQEAQSEVARRSNAVITELKNLKVDKLQTTNISLNPKIVVDSDNKQRQVGFVAQISMSFVTSNDRSGIAIDRAIATGANRVIQITFSAEDEAIRTARNFALQDAVKDAQVQANAVLSSINLKSQSIRTIKINGDNPQTYNITNSRLNSVSDSSTSIVGGEQRVEASVTLEITY
jgi:uncharacterized protein